MNAAFCYYEGMKITAITMITNPEYRQDPWKESIGQAAELFDNVVVVYGREEDEVELNREFQSNQKIKWYYMDWPQPEWTYDELARHLNFALENAKKFNPDWVIKFDIDHLFHENDRDAIYKSLLAMKYDGTMLAQFEKLQFFLVDRAYEKGKVPLGINMKYDICYGVDKTKYTDLCQPVIRCDKMVKYRQGKHEIPVGEHIPDDKMRKTGIHVWNYDYSFKTLERAMELLYYFDRSHAKWWGAGYHGMMLENITPESATGEYIELVKGRITKPHKFFSPDDHPKHIRERIRNILPEEFGHSLWGKIEIPKE